MDLEGMNYNVVLRMVQQFPSGVNIEAVEQGIRALLLTPTTENTVAEFDKKLVMLAYSIWVRWWHVRRCGIGGRGTVVV